MDWDGVGSLDSLNYVDSLHSLDYIHEQPFKTLTRST